MFFKHPLFKGYSLQLPLLLLIGFFLLFSAISWHNMASLPFHDFDEAHRAEGARNMRLHQYYVSPLVGGPTNRCNHLDPTIDTKLQQTHANQRHPFVLDSSKILCTVPSRPPLVFNNMALTSALFNDSEWSYRLPSFLFGLLGFAGVGYFMVKHQKLEKNNSTSNNFEHITAAIVALLCFVTAYDWWQSMQMAHLDTAVASFTAITLLLLILFIKSQKKIYLVASGVSLGLAIMSKGPPAVVFAFALPYLLLTGKISIKNLLILFISSGITLLPWLIPLSFRQGVDYFFRSYFGGFIADPGATKIGGSDHSQAAPIYWYARWWFDSFRPGWILFIALTGFDLIKKKLGWQKIALLFYIVGTLGLFSYSNSKVWWYVLPAIPAIASYIYFSVKDYLLNRKQGLINIALIVVLSSLPIFRFQSNTVALGYGLLLTVCSFGLLIWSKWPEKISILVKKLTPQLLAFALLISLVSFLSTFPKSDIPYPEAKEIGVFYQEIDQPKCLWLEPELHYEALLFYTQAGQVNYLTPQNELSPDCNNYLITTQEMLAAQLINKIDRLWLYQLD